MDTTKIVVDGSKIIAIADAVRSQTGSEEEMSLSEITDEIYSLNRTPKEAVLYIEQSLTDEQKAQARENIGISGESINNSLIGTTEDITPTQVKEALDAGSIIKISHTHETYGIGYSNHFTYVENFNAVLSSDIIQYDGAYLLTTLYGNMTTNKWNVYIEPAVTTDDIPKALQVVFFDNGDGTGTADKEFSVIKAAYDNGSAITGRIDREGASGVIINSITYEEGIEAFAISGVSFDGNYWAAMIDSSNSVMVGSMPFVGSGSAVYVNITENEDGTFSADKTAAELAEAYNKGCAIYAKLYEAILSLVVVLDEESEKVIAFSALYDNTSVCFVIIENFGEDTDDVTFELLPIGGEGSGNIPEALPNPEALTINGKEYDGSEAVSIDTTPFEIKITADESGNYTSNKTGEEIIAAYEEGRQLFCVDGTVKTPLTKYNYHLNVQRRLQFFSSTGTTYKSILINFKVGSKVINNITVTEGTYATEKEENGVLIINGQIFNGSNDVTIDTRDFIFNVTGNQEDGYTSETPSEEIFSAYQAGRNIVCYFCGEIFTNFYVPLVTVDEDELLFGVSPMSGVSVFVAVSSDGVYAEETNNETSPLIGTMAEITPTQVKEALNEGKPICLASIDAQYGICYSNNFAYAVDFNEVFSSSIVKYGDDYMVIALYGNLETDTWSTNVTPIATYDQIPETLPNPEVLTINGKAYNGSQAVDYTTTINDMIDAKNRTYSSLIPKGTSIQENADLNTIDYLKVGNYYCSKNATIPTLSNCPAGKAFLMQVYSPLSPTIDNEQTGTWVYRTRKIMTYEGDEFIQSVYSNDTKGNFIYGIWKQIIKSNNIDSSLSPTSTNPIQNKVVYDKFSSFKPSVRDYGAKGDGTTDDTAAFQVALAENRLVYVPEGTYKLSGTLIVRPNCELELSQATHIKFTQTSGNCIELRSSATLRGNHAVIEVPYAFTGNVISADTQFDTGTRDTPPFTYHWDPMWKRARYIYDICIIKPNSAGICVSYEGNCSGTGIYISAKGKHLTEGDINYIWGAMLQGVRIAGAFTYGIHAENIDDPNDDSEDDAWNHDMRIEAVIQGCETGAYLFNCNLAHLAITIQPSTCDGNSTYRYNPYAKWGIKLEDCKGVDMTSCFVWDWQGARKDSEEFTHIAMYGNCTGLVLGDYLYHANSTTDIRKQIYSDRPSNLEKMTVLQEPITRWFKVKDEEPYFYPNGVEKGIEKKLVTQEELKSHFVTDKIKEFEDVLQIATDGNGNVFNNKGYVESGYYIATDGSMTASEYYGCTGFIPIKSRETLYVENIVIPTAGDGWSIFVMYDSSFQKIGTQSITSNELFQTGTHYYWKYTPLENGFKVIPSPNNDPTNCAYIRFGFKTAWLKGTPVASVNKEISYSQAGFLADGIKVKAENIEGLNNLTDDHINSLIDNKLGVIENGSY